MKIGMKKMLTIEKCFENTEEYDMFEVTRITNNLNKINNIMVSLLTVSVALLVSFYWSRGIYFKEINNLQSMQNVLIVLVLMTVVWFLYYYLFNNKITFSSMKIAHWIFYNIIIYWSISITVVIYNVNGQLAHYIIGTFIISSVLFLKPQEIMITNLLSSVIVLMLFDYFYPNLPLRQYHYIALISTIVFSSVLSINIFSYFARNYIVKLNLEKTNETLLALENSKTDYFTNISHELKTPLNILYSCHQMLEQSYKQGKTESVSKYLKMSKQNINRLNRLISNVIDISKIESSSFKVILEEIDIVMLVENIVQSAVGYCEDAGIELIFDTDVEEIVMACDPDAIERVVLNLMSNAIKYSKPNSTILVNMKLKDPYVKISVIDQGEGIPCEMLHKIFDRYAQVDKLAKEKREGSGIGLALVKSLVELHKGDIDIKSEYGVGTDVSVSIPINLITTNVPKSESGIFNNKIQKINIEFSDIYQ